MYLYEIIGKELNQKLADYLIDNCDSCWTAEMYLEEFALYPTDFIKRDAEDFFDIIEEYEKKDPENDTGIYELSRKLSDKLEGNIIYDVITAVNSGDLIIYELEFDEYIRQYILPQFDESNRDIYDFWTQYGGQSMYEIIKDFTLYDNDIRIYKDLKAVYMVNDNSI